MLLKHISVKLCYHFIKFLFLFCVINEVSEQTSRTKLSVLFATDFLQSTEAFRT